MTNDITRVVVADDNLLIRQGLVSLLELIDGVQVIGQASDVDELLVLLDQELPEVVITDIRMPPTHTTEGIDAAVKLRKKHPELGVIVLSQFSEPEYVMMLFRDGSDRLGYLLKERLGDIGQLKHAIHSVVEGGSAVDAKVVDVMVSGGPSTDTSRIDSLSPRERQVLSLIAEGLNNSTIAERLDLTTKAVSNHINNIFSKLDLRGDPESDRRVRAVLLWLADRSDGE